MWQFLGAEVGAGWREQKRCVKGGISAQDSFLKEMLHARQGLWPLWDLFWGRDIPKDSGMIHTRAETPLKKLWPVENQHWIRDDPRGKIACGWPMSEQGKASKKQGVTNWNHDMHNPNLIYCSLPQQMAWGGLSKYCFHAENKQYWD